MAPQWLRVAPLVLARLLRPGCFAASAARPGLVLGPATSRPAVRGGRDRSVGA